MTASADKTARLWDAASGKPLGEPMTHDAAVYLAQFSPNGQRVVTASADQTARLWDVPAINNKDSDEELLLLADLAEGTTGVTLQISGRTEILHLMTADEIKAMREKVTAGVRRPSSNLTPFQQFLKWSISEPRSRTVSPFSEVTVAEWVENRITDGTLAGLRAALQTDPANARLAAHVGRGLANHALEVGLNLDEARLARAEADLQTRRALRLAPGNDEVKRLRAEVVVMCLGALDGDQNQPEQARQAYEEALKLYRELVQKNPKAYLADAAQTLY